MNRYLSAPQLVFEQQSRPARICRKVYSASEDSSNKLKRILATSHLIKISYNRYTPQQHEDIPIIGGDVTYFNITYIDGMAFVYIPKNQKFARRYVKAIIRIAPDRIIDCCDVVGLRADLRRCRNLKYVEIFIEDTLNLSKIPIIPTLKIRIQSSILYNSLGVMSIYGDIVLKRSLLSRADLLSQCTDILVQAQKKLSCTKNPIEKISILKNIFVYSDCACIFYIEYPLYK